MQIFAKTDIGKARDMNQDYYYVAKETDPLKLYILADGMGGYKGGEVASRLATNATKGYIESNFEQIEHDKENILKLIKSAMEYANMVVHEKAKEQKELEGMGTTLEVCLIYNNRAYIGHVGDSRIYRIRKDIIRQLTTDHSYVEKLVKDGTITKEEAQHHPKKNMLTKALGCEVYVEPDAMVKGFLKEDVIIMCSDGLTNLVKEEAIFQIIKNNVQVASQNLINVANDLGGYDNITVIIINYN